MVSFTLDGRRFDFTFRIFLWRKPGLDFNAKTTILEIQDLKLPNDNVRPELYTDADRKSLCLMISLGRFVKCLENEIVVRKQRFILQKHGYLIIRTQDVVLLQQWHVWAFPDESISVRYTIYW